MLQLQADEDSYPGRSPPTPPKIQIGFSKLDAITALKDLKSGLLGLLYFVNLVFNHKKLG